MILAVTGHRPDKLFPRDHYSAASLQRLVDFTEIEIKRFQPETVITGMALGWDQAVALACISLGIMFVAAVPFDGQESRWPPESQRKYRDMLAHAALVKVVSPGGYAGWKMQRRNVWSVDELAQSDDPLLALWNGSSGGTANCVRYAQERNVAVENCWERWEKFNAQLV